MVELPFLKVMVCKLIDSPDWCVSYKIALEHENISIIAVSHNIFKVY